MDPEVSSVDFTLATTLVPGGSPVPGLNVRKSQSTVELKQGDTLAIAGLMQLEIDGSTQKIPGLGDLPYIGGFFSNTTSNRVEKELIVLVTPYIIEPMAPGQVPPSPGDEVVQPNDLEFFLLNRIEGRTGRDGRSTTSYDDPLHLIRHSMVERTCLIGPSGFSEMTGAERSQGARAMTKSTDSRGARCRACSWPGSALVSRQRLQDCRTAPAAARGAAGSAPAVADRGGPARPGRPPTVLGSPRPPTLVDPAALARHPPKHVAHKRESFHWRRLQGRLLGYPEDFRAPPLGAALYDHGRTMVANGEAARLSLFQYDFVQGRMRAESPGPGSAREARGEAGRRPVSLIIEPTPDDPALA